MTRLHLSTIQRASS